MHIQITFITNRTHIDKEVTGLSGNQGMMSNSTIYE